MTDVDSKSPLRDTFASTFLPLLVALYQISSTRAVAIDNEVTGTPTINCGTEQIDFWVTTRNAFSGKIYVKGEYGRPECTNVFRVGQQQQTGTTFEPISTLFTTAVTRPAGCPPCPTCSPPPVSSSQSPVSPTTAGQVDPNTGHIIIKLATCNAKRDRSLQPAGVQISFTVVVSFHQHFVTKVDRAYTIQCMYLESDRTVTSEINVSMPQSTELNGNVVMPVCEYVIRRGSADGEPIRFARVGDTVFHTWRCTTDIQGMWGMLVHDCTVEDGQGQTAPIIDERGCTLDRFVLPDLSYEGDLSASVEAHVFKFADRDILDFQCAMSICVKVDGSCQGITPPVCNVSRAANVKRRRRAVHESLVSANSASYTAEELMRRKLLKDNKKNQWRIHAPSITVLDLDDSLDPSEIRAIDNIFAAKRKRQQDQTVEHVAGEREMRRTSGEPEADVCLSAVTFGMLVSLCTFIFTLAAIVLGTLHFFKTRTIVRRDCKLPYSQ